jgi:hypothetical protein
MNFEKSRQKSFHIAQYTCKCTGRLWWNSKTNNICRNCNQPATRLTLRETIGIGWFQCACGRRYAGFCQGNVTSKCHGCQKENLALFIVPGDKADREDREKRNTHYCAVCKGEGGCPIVEKVKTHEFTRR